MMAPKGIVDKVTGISRSVDHVDKLYSILSGELNIKDETELRFTPIGKEVTEWRALLRYSRFLLNENETDVFNIHGEVINPDMANISKILSEKRSSYYKAN